MKFGILTLDDFDFRAKTVLCRLDVNSPFEKDKYALKDTSRIQAAIPTIKELQSGEILLLDNVRYMAEEMTLFETKLKLPPEAQAKTIVVAKLAPLADIYVCDAFAAAHRDQPTLGGFEELLPSAMGSVVGRGDS